MTVETNAPRVATAVTTGVALIFGLYALSVVVSAWMS
jgi:hypothetical protein